MQRHLATAGRICATIAVAWFFGGWIGSYVASGWIVVEPFKGWVPAGLLAYGPLILQWFFRLALFAELMREWVIPQANLQDI